MPNYPLFTYKIWVFIEKMKIETNQKCFLEKRQIVPHFGTPFYRVKKLPKQCRKTLIAYLKIGLLSN